MTAHLIPTGEHDVNVLFRVTATKPVILRIKGIDTSNPNTVYFDREIGTKEKPFVGTKLLRSPMPISPKNLSLIIFDNMTKSDENIHVDNVSAIPLSKKMTVFNTPKDYDFVKFAEWFAKNAGWMPLGIYKNKDGKYGEIMLCTIIKNPDGKISTTPARMFRPEGNIQISKTHFDKMTIPMRMLILLHEYSHYRANTRDERKADEYALKMYLGLGYSESEAVHAFTKVFTPANITHATALSNRTKQLVTQIKNSTNR